MRSRAEQLTAYIYISPFFILFGVFGVFPIFYTAYISLHKWNLFGEREFIGFQNYQWLLTDPLFYKAVSNTFILWGLSTIPMIALSFFLAVVVNQKKLFGKQLYRMGLFLPNITSIVAVTLVFSILFGTHYGLLNLLLDAVGFSKVDWKSTVWGSWAALSMMSVWRWTGYNMIIFLAGLQSISEDLYEAAFMDGASRAKQFFYITIPLMRPIILFVVILSTIGGMQMFTEPYLFLGTGSNGEGGILNQGLTIVLYLYNEAFERHSFGYASALAWALFFIILAFSALNSLLVKRLRGTD